MSDDGDTTFAVQGESVLEISKSVEKWLTAGSLVRRATATFEVLACQPAVPRAPSPAPTPRGAGHRAHIRGLHSTTGCAFAGERAQEPRLPRGEKQARLQQTRSGGGPRRSRTSPARTWSAASRCCRRWSSCCSHRLRRPAMRRAASATSSRPHSCRRPSAKRALGGGDAVCTALPSSRWEPRMLMYEYAMAAFQRRP
jgi:hypothetical protein